MIRRKNNLKKKQNQTRNFYWLHRKSREKEICIIVFRIEENAFGKRVWECIEKGLAS